MSARTERPFPGWLLPALILPLFAAQLLIFHWGAILPDTVEQYRQALSGRYEDWHPPIMAWLWRQATRVTPGSAPMLVLDCALYWSGLGLIADGLRRQGKGVSALLVIAIGLLPIPFGQMGAVLKDSLLAALALAVSGIVLWHNLAHRPLWPATRLLCLCLVVLAAATRFNAFLALAPILAMLVPERWRTTVTRTLLLTILSAGLLLLSSHLIDGVLLKPLKTNPFLSLVAFDLAGMSVDEQHNLFPQYAPAEGLALSRHCYVPAQFNHLGTPECYAMEDGLHDWLEREKVDPVRFWLATIAAHPIAYAEHRLAHFDRNMRFMQRDVPADAIFLMSAPNPYGLRFVPGVAAKAVYRAASVMAASPFGRPVTWLAIAALLLLFVRQAPVTMLAASATFYGGGYLVVSVAPDLRYNLWTMIAGMLALVLAVAKLRKGLDLRSR